MFPGIVGHNEVCQHLVSLYQSRRLPSSMLFSGPEGVGKRTVAHALARWIFCHPEGQTAANAGALFDSGNHPDFHVLGLEEGKKDISIDAVRELIETCHLRPVSASRSIAVIDSAHRLSTAASNALLMTLEAPPEHCTLILISEHPGGLLQTIRSRCRPILFGILSADDVKEVLLKLSKDDTLDGTILETLVTHSAGALGDLELAAFIDPRTLRVSDPKGLASHLRDISALVAELLQHLESVGPENTRNPDLAAARAANAAAELASQKISRAFLWRTVVSHIRRSLRTKPDSKTAGALLDAVLAEQLTRERNAQLELQLTKLLLP